MYDSVKDSLLSGGHIKDGVPLHLASAMLAGVSATLVASPVDVIKTRSRSCHHVTVTARYSSRFLSGFGKHLPL